MKRYKFTQLSFEAQQVAMQDYMNASNGLITDNAHYYLSDSNNVIYNANGKIWYEDKENKFKKQKL